MHKHAAGNAVPAFDPDVLPRQPRRRPETTTPPGGIALTSPPKVALVLVTFTCFVTALLSSCKLEEPQLPFTGSSSAGEAQGSFAGTSSPPPSGSGASQNGLGAPTIVSPLPGNTFTESRPRLTVRNVTTDDGSRPSYDFQVATDDAFQGMVAETQGQAEGGSGETSWQVTTALDVGRYYWRSRAVGSRGPGPYSPISDFSISSSASSPQPPPSSGELFDPLTNGRSIGDQRGGRFMSEGWQVTSRGDFIRYVVPTIQSGFVEWENLGLRPYNPAADLYTLFGMWDPTKGDYRENPFRVHLRKLDTQGHNPPYVRLRFISGGDQHDVGYDFLSWNPGKAYRWRIEWGPTGSGNEARVLLDGRVITRTSYGPAYRPTEHWIEMGVEERAESIVGVIYRNVVIGRR